MKNAKSTMDAKNIARSFAAMLKAGLGPFGHTGIVPPVASDVEVEMTDDSPFCNLTLEVTVAPGLTMPLSANALAQDERTAAELQAAADRIVVGLEWAWRFRGEYVTAIADARPHCENAVANARAEGLTLKLIEVGLERRDARDFDHLDRRDPIDSVRVCAKVECLNDVLMPAQELLAGWSGEDLAERIDHMLDMQRLRRDRKIMLKGAGASGLIDAFALNLINAEGADLPTALHDLAAEGCTMFAGDKVAGEDKNFVVSLAMPSFDGVAQVEVRLSDKIMWQYNKLVIRGMELPETMISALHDQPVTKLVQHPLLQDDMIIEGFERVENALRVSVRTPTHFYDAESSRVWQ